MSLFSNKAGTKPGPRSANSCKEIADAVGRSETAVRKWFANPAWNLGSTGPWDIAAVKAWAAKHLSQGSFADGPADAADLSEERRAKLDLTRERRRKIKHENAIREGLYVLKTDVEAGRLERITACRAGLLQLPKLGPQLAGMTATEIEKVLDAEVIKLLAEFSRQPADE